MLFVIVNINLIIKMKNLRPVTHPTPAATLLVIIKRSYRTRLCLDRTDINKFMKQHHFPLKTAEEIAVCIGSANYVTILHAKKRILSNFRVLINIRLFNSLYTYEKAFFPKLPLGLTSALEIFHQVMHSLLCKFENTECLLKWDSY